MEVLECYNLGATLEDVFAESIYPLDSRILLVPLNEDQHKCWLKFQDSAKWRWKHLNVLRETGFLEVHLRENKRCFHCGEVSIEVDHPFVPVVGDFAVAAFNELCRMYVKKDIEDNVYEAQVIKVTHSLNRYGYNFFITLEAMEENVAGVYEAIVLCHYDDGRQTLIKFIRSPCPPVGMRFKRMVDLIREKSMYAAVKEEKKAKKAELKIRSNAIKGKKRSRESTELICLKKDYKALKGACRIFDQHAHLLKQIDWKIKSSNPGLDDWFIPNKITGLQLRTVEHSCGGYDYHNPLKVFSCYADGTS
ncbi:hypothetical protein CTI12_AA073490 [Artemisia annua]|uniref:Uncharacterized protein n=1 Tax=Artemisia annua TaxID=35608 RepID=A0A2U1Q591_ARTAN|nr:hypothetical protein CTI12_AA073490 [Artemisia annua]